MGKSLTIKGVTLILLLVGVSGCARLNSIHRTHDFQENSALIDIKQRAIIANDRISEVSDSGEKKYQSQRVVCAEPSPDSLSAFAAELAANVETKGVAVGVASAFRESSSFVGLRTQSIQLLRDQFYRLCESYAPGAINKVEFGAQSRRYQRNMIVLLAIETLTGVVRAPTVSISHTNSASVATSLRTVGAAIDANKEDLDAVEAEIASLKTKISEAAAGSPEKTMLEEQKERAEKRQKRLAEEGERLEKLYQNAGGVAVGGTGNVQVVFPEDQGEQVREGMSIVADAVLKLVDKHLSRQDDGLQLCLSAMVHKPEILLKHEDFLKACKTRLESEMSIQATQPLYDKDGNAVSLAVVTK